MMLVPTRMRDGTRPSAELSPGVVPPVILPMAWRGGLPGLRFGACCSPRPRQPTTLCIFAVGQAGRLPGARAAAVQRGPGRHPNLPPGLPQPDRFPGIQTEVLLILTCAYLNIQQCDDEEKLFLVPQRVSCFLFTKEGGRRHHYLSRWSVTSTACFAEGQGADNFCGCSTDSSCPRGAEAVVRKH